MKQDIDYGLSPGDGEGEVLFYAFEKVKENFDELYLGGERDTFGNVVYPDASSQTNARNPDGTLNYIETIVSGVTYRQTFSYNTEGLVGSVTATKTGGYVWVKTFTYNIDGTTASSSAWVLQ